MSENIPAGVMKALRMLHGAGFEAYLVGGCIRSLLLQTAPKDYDITTSAEPDQVLRVFQAYQTVETGLQHGTVMVVIDDWPLEITTYRVDGPYTDSRRPDLVHFTRSLREDLARRDFTINAMAWSPFSGPSAAGSAAAGASRPFSPDQVIDPFDGRRDLTARLIRCVGDPVRRFREDALRILRALRFAATLDFQLDERTADAIRGQKAALAKVANERISAEFGALLCGGRAGNVLRDYLDVVAVFLPELLPLKGFDQHNPHHHLDLLTHVLQVVDAVPPEPALRLSALLHDIGKPGAQTRDEAGISHYYGHQQAGALISRIILERLRWDKNTINQVIHLVRHHDSLPDATLASVRRWLSRHTAETARAMLILKKADILAQSPALNAAKLAHLRQIELLTAQVTAGADCYTLQALAVDGHDLLELGCSRGPLIGRILQELLGAVIDGQVPNERQALLAAARRIIAEA